MKRVGALSVIFILFSSCARVSPTAPEGSLLYVSANPTSIPADGGTSTITIIGYDTTGIPLSNETVIYFSTDIGSIDQTTKIKNGTATSIFKSDGRSGIAHIYITSGKATASPSPLEIIVGSAALSSLTIGANPGVLSTGGGSATITAAAFDGSSNPLAGLPIVFTADGGSLKSGGKIIFTDQNGEAVDFLTTTTDTKVTANAGNLSASITITVATNTSPIANFVFSPKSPYIGDTVFFNASESLDKDGRIISYKWDFGDGYSGSGIKSSHVYTNAGSYQVSLRVKDNHGAWGSYVQSVPVQEIENSAPQASFVLSPTNPKVGDTIYFNASNSYDSDGYIVSYAWDFGDGSSGSGQQTSHVFTYAGNFQITLVVRDNNGATGAVSQNVTVSN